MPVQCPICGFENMPGEAVCTRCRSRLTVSDAEPAGELSPPRAGMFKPLRPIAYLVNRMVDAMPVSMSERLARAFRGDAILPGGSIAAMFLSVVPGAGHAADGRRRAAFVAFGVWLTALVLIANFYFGVAFTVLFGFLIIWHTVVVFDAGRVQRHAARLSERLRVMGFILLVSCFAYLGLDGLTGFYVDTAAAPCAFEAAGVQEGDVLTVRLDTDGLRRGDIVGIYRQGRSRTVQVTGMLYLDLRMESIVLATLVALPGDRVDVSGEGVRVNGRLVDAKMMPGNSVQLPARPLSLTVGESDVLAAFPFRQPGYDGNVDIAAVVWQNVYLMPMSDLLGRAVGIYLPLARRKRLRGGSAQ
jgi:hypothetical protein